MSSISLVGRKALTLVAALALSTTALAATTAQAADGFTSTFETGAFAPIPFGGEAANIVADAPAGFSGSGALKIVSGNQTWSGTTFANEADYKLISIGNTTVTGKVKAPAAGKPIMLKIENAEVGGIFKEATAFTTGTGWETLTWTFTDLAEGATYNKASIFSDFNTVSTGDIYYYDDIAFPAVFTGSTPRTADSTLVTFEENDATGYISIAFEGAEADIAAVPAGGNGGNGLKVTRPGGQPWAGVSILEGSAGTVKFTSAANKIVTMNFYTDTACPVMLQLKVGTDIVEQKVDAPAGWSKLSFDFGATTFTGTYLDAKEYVQVAVFPNFGTVGSGQVYYFDNIGFNGATTPEIPTVNPPTKATQSIAKSATAIRVGKMASMPSKTNKGLSVRWVSKTKAICSVSGTKVKGLKAGVCKLVGTNAGNDANKAVSVARTMKVKK